MRAEGELKAPNKEMKVLNREVVLAAEKAARMETLHKSEQRFMQVVESAPNAMILVNTLGTIELTNAQVENIFGYTRAELIGQPVEKLIPQRFQQQHPALRHNFFSAPTPRPMGAERDLFGLHKSGNEFPIEIGLNPIDTETGTMILASVVDLTLRVKAAASLAAHAEALERRNSELKSFAYVASHDLKSPLRPRDQVEGSGMGLAIIKKTIEAFSGTICLTANSPRGSIFTFTWPRDLARVQNLAHPDAQLSGDLL